jgi:hypothetical protein
MVYRWTKVTNKMVTTANVIIEIEYLVALFILINLVHPSKMKIKIVHFGGNDSLKYRKKPT